MTHWPLYSGYTSERLMSMRQSGPYSSSQAGIEDLVEMLLHSVHRKLRQKLLDDTRQAA